MHPSVFARSTPEKPAVIMAASGETITYAALDARSNQAAHFFRAHGLQIGDVVAICLENHPRYFELVWGAQRAGLYFVAISNRLTAPEIAYILKDCGARLVITSTAMATVMDAVRDVMPGLKQLRCDSGADDSADTALAAMPETPIADERAGTDMLYSSGTTGNPKGIRSVLPEDPQVAQLTALTVIAERAFGITQDSIYLSPAPLYHAAPLRWCMCVHRLGGTVVVLEKFDPEFALAMIEKYQVTDSQWVPTHFVRMLKLPDEARAKFDLSSLKCAIHAAAPCPVPVKRAMIDWWGPVLKEYYAGTEGNGFTFITSEEWLTHLGSVGRALSGVIHICGEDGEELPRRKEGQVFFENNSQFEYYNDPVKTAESRNQHGWSSLGDVGWEDEEGYLYLTDRKSFMIISGGVNIYPQEIENLLVVHPRVADVAVIGAPDPEFGEKVIAVVQPINFAESGEDFAEELKIWLAPQLSKVKMPKVIDFRAELPRHPTGKLYKRLLRDEYWAAVNASQAAEA